MSNPYRILSLDGGGSWALIQVRCLQELFGAARRGHEVLRCFDLVAANSGGSIVLAGLVADMPLQVILALFQDDASRHDLFAPTSEWGWRLEHALARVSRGVLPEVGPHYATARKLAALREHLPALNGLCLHQVPEYVSGPGAQKPHVLIPTFDYTRQRSTFFRSDLESMGNSDKLEAVLTGQPVAAPPGKTIELLQAVQASSTAPINYFDTPAHVVLDGQPNYLWDGGVAGYNNPVLAAVTEALANRVLAEDMQVLSIGTGAQLYPVLSARQTAEFSALTTKAKANDGFFQDVLKVATAIVGAPPDSASYVAFTALNPQFAQSGYHNRNFIRANPLLRPRLVGNHWCAPPGYDSDRIKAIRKLGLDAIEPKQVELVKGICEAWLAGRLPNQPVRANAHLECLLGQDTFAEARRLFEELFSNCL